jgi:deoxyribodipyrimidine photolyase-related protein
MIESDAEATHVWSHKQRIAIFLAAMRHRARLLRQQGFAVDYCDLSSSAGRSLNELLRVNLQTLEPKRLIVLYPGEYRLLQLCLKRFASTQPAELAPMMMWS